MSAARIARLRMRAPDVIEALIAHYRETRCADQHEGATLTTEGHCTDMIISVLEWVLNRPTDDNSLAQGSGLAPAAGKTKDSD